MESVGILICHGCGHSLMAFQFHEFIVLLHVLGAAAWFGAGAFAITIIKPAVDAAGPAGKQFMMAILRRGGYGKWFGPAAILTVAAGLYLYFDLRLHQDPFASVGSGMLTVGAIFGLLAFAMSLAGAVPTENKMKAIVAQIPEDGPPSPEQMQEMQALAAKAYKDNVRTVGLLGIAIVLMAGHGIIT